MAFKMAFSLENKKAEPNDIKGSAHYLSLFFFFGHERVEDFFNHIPFFVCFDLF